MAQIIVRRNDPKDIKIRGLEVWLDGQIVADLQYGGAFEKEIASGPHTLKVTNSLYSKSEDFELAEDEVIGFVASNIAKGVVGPMMIAALGIGPYQVALQRLT